MIDIFELCVWLSNIGKWFITLGYILEGKIKNLYLMKHWKKNKNTVTHGNKMNLICFAHAVKWGDILSQISFFSYLNKIKKNS